MTTLAWSGHKNGQIPLSALALIPNTNKQYIKKSLLPGLQALRAAFKKHFGTQLDIVEAYRDLRRQENLRYAWVHHYPGYNLAAIPGTSLHGWALSVDFGSGVNIYGSAEKKWMDKHAPAYGFLPTGNGFDPREAWHFDGTGRTYVASTGHTTTIPKPESEFDMSVIKYYYKTDKPQIEYGIYGMELPGGYRVSTDENTGSAWGRLYGKDDGAPWLKLSGEQWLKLQAEARAINADWVAQQKEINGTK